MISFLNGLSINGNPQMTKTDSGILITNDFGLKIEISDNIWHSFWSFK